MLFFKTFLRLLILNKSIFVKSLTEQLRLISPLFIVNSYLQNVKRLLRGVEIDQIEQISKGMPFADIKYGEGQIKVICEKN